MSITLGAIAFLSGVTVIVSWEGVKRSIIEQAVEDHRYPPLPSARREELVLPRLVFDYGMRSAMSLEERGPLSHPSDIASPKETLHRHKPCIGYLRSLCCDAVAEQSAAR